MQDDSVALKKLNTLKNALAEFENVLVAFSGGVDSAFLLKAALDTLGKKNVVAVTARSVIHPVRETEQAVLLAKEIGAPHIMIETDELSIPEFVRNPQNRCYICKKALFWKMRNQADILGIRTIIEGSNADDLSDFRPGIRALHELGIKSPLLEAGLTKNEIRKLSREMGLATWEKQSFACLATRFPYGDIITREKLMMIDRCENYLLKLGFKQVRVRCHGDMARIELGRDEICRLFSGGLADRVDSECRAAGFACCTVDLKGYRTGSMNKTIFGGNP
jgi:uncharacterized protein